MAQGGMGVVWDSLSSVGGLRLRRGFGLNPAGMGLHRPGRPACSPIFSPGGWGCGKPAPQRRDSMQLYDIIAHKHGVDAATAHRILWRKCLGLRPRLAVALLGWWYTKARDDLNDMIRELGRSGSRREAQSNVVFYKERWMSGEPGGGVLLFGFSARRLLRISSEYFADAADEAGEAPVRRGGRVVREDPATGGEGGGGGSEAAGGDQPGPKRTPPRRPPGGGPARP